MITETVFAVPGVGRLMVDSIFARDYPVIQALTLALAVLVSAGLPGHRHRADGARPADRAMKRCAASPLPLIVRRSRSCCCCWSAPWRPARCIAPYDPLSFDYSALLAPPSLAHPFGTDQFGRDILSRTISASSIDLQIALFATIFPLFIGCLIGLLVGWYGGWLDMVFGRLVDLVVTFPFLVLVIAIVAVLGPGPDQHVYRHRRPSAGCSTRG